MKINKFTYCQHFSNQEELSVEVEVDDNPEVNLKNLLEVKKLTDRLSVKYGEENQRKQEYIRCMGVVKNKKAYSVEVINTAEKFVKEYEQRSKDT